MKKDFNKTIKSTKEEIALHAIYGHRGEYCSKHTSTQIMFLYAILFLNFKQRIYLLNLNHSEIVHIFLRIADLHVVVI